MVCVRFTQQVTAWPVGTVVRMHHNRAAKYVDNNQATYANKGDWKAHGRCYFNRFETK